MAALKRHKTAYPGVFYIIGTEIGYNRKEKIFYIRYRKDGKLVEEKAGRAKQDDMTAARAATLRAAKISGDKPQNIEKREIKERKRRAEANRWTIDKLWQEYASQKDENKAFKTDKGRQKLETWLKRQKKGNGFWERTALDSNKFRSSGS